MSCCLDMIMITHVHRGIGALKMNFGILRREWCAARSLFADTFVVCCKLRNFWLQNSDGKHASAPLML